MKYELGPSDFDPRVVEFLGLVAQWKAEAFALIFGGAVRDTILGTIPKDHDIEIYHLDASEVEKFLAKTCDQGFKEVGKSFGVFKASFHGLELDISIPRVETKTGPGHRDFEIELRPFMHPSEACLRRDFTINAMGYGLKFGLLDFNGGLQHLEDKTLHPTSSQFSEDVLRVVRGFQFIARFLLKMSYDCQVVCANLFEQAPTIDLDRYWPEWEKLLMKGTKPSLGLQAMVDTGWINLYPELKRLIGCKQHPTWHPEGDVWTHTLLALDAAAAMTPHPPVEVMLAILCHDMGKPDVTDPVTFKAHKHDEAGVPHALSFMKRIISVPDSCKSGTTEIMDIVVPLVREHMVLTGSAELTDKAIRKLSKRLATSDNPDRSASIEKLEIVMRADRLASSAPGGLEPLAKMLARSKELGAERQVPEPIIRGRDLMELGMKEGREMGALLKRIELAFDEGQIKDRDAAIAMAKDAIGGAR